MKLPWHGWVVLDAGGRVVPRRTSYDTLPRSIREPRLFGWKEDAKRGALRHSLAQGSNFIVREVALVEEQGGD